MLTRGARKTLRPCGRHFRIVSRRAAYVSNPPGGRKQAAVYFFSPPRRISAGADSGLRKVSKSTGNCALLFPLRSPRATFATSVSTRESILFRVPPFSQCFRGGKSATTNAANADFTKQQRSACAGSNYAWIMREEAGSCAGAEWEVIEKGGNGGVAGSVIARAEKNWPADGNRWTQIAKDGLNASR